MMYCPIQSKKLKLERCCIICTKDSCSAKNSGELTSIFLSYMFPPSDKEEITIKLLPLFTFCEECSSILEGLIQLHKTLECIQTDIQITVNDIKVVILKNANNEKITDLHVQNFRKIATRDYNPVVKLKKADVLCTKSDSLKNSTDNRRPTDKDVHYAQQDRESIVTQPKGSQTSGDFLKPLNKNTCDNQRINLEISRSVKTTISTAFTAFSTDSETVEYNQENQSQPPHNAFQSTKQFSTQQQQSSIGNEVLIEMESNLRFQEEEQTVKFEPWTSFDGHYQEEEDIFFPHNSHQEIQIIENLPHILSDNYNGMNAIQQSHVIESQPQPTNKYPTLIAALNKPYGLQSESDPEDRAIKSTLWTPPDGVAQENIPNTESHSKISIENNHEEHRSTLTWAPPIISSQFNNTQSNRVSSKSHKPVTHSSNLWLPEGFSPINVQNNTSNVSTDNTNYNYSTYCKNVATKHLAKKRKVIKPSAASNISTTKKYDSPPFTFAQMIFIAITNSPNHCATPDAIWEFIVNTFPFYKDYYHMKRLACQLLTEGLTFEETSAKSNDNQSLPSLPQLYFVKRFAVGDFINQIKTQITMCDTFPSCYMVNPDHYLKASLGNEYDIVVPTTSAQCTLNYPHPAQRNNQDEQMLTLENDDEDEILIVKEVTRSPIYNEPLVSSTTVEPKYELPFNKPPLSQAVIAAIVIANSDTTPLTCPAICELMWNRFPFYKNQKDTLPKRLYPTLTASKFFVRMFNGGLPFSLFCLDIENKKAMEDLKKEFRRFLFLNPDYICKCIANPHELEALARKVFGKDFDNGLALSMQRVNDYISQKP